MTKLTLVAAFCLSAIPASAGFHIISPAYAVVPAPLIGAGIPFALVVGGGWLGSKLVKLWRK